MSPTVFRHKNFRFHFFSREEPRMHSHAHCEHGGAKFWIEPDIALARSFGLTESELRLLRSAIEDLMKSKVPGTPISEVEVTNISRHGIWILLGDEELFLPFRDFPWFEAAPISAIVHLKILGPGHLYWPDLDIDLTVESVKHPEKYPLVSKVMPNHPIKSTSNHA